jgi:DNA-binding MarR family transcriptional regulator
MMYMHYMKPKYPSAGDKIQPVLQPQALLEVCLCHHVRRAARAITRLFDEALQPTSLKASQFNILTAVAAGDLTSVAELSRVLVLDRTTLSRNLKPLRQDGYLTMDGGAGRRPDVVALTEAGRTILDQATDLWRKAQGDLTQRLGAGGAGQLLHSLEAAAKAAI